jgi:outer membrane scaffolding protein for murein synthesis (MipA/OmpV family)
LFGGDDDYAATYFGVTGDEAGASSFDAFDASGGLISRGLEASVSYDFNEDWGVTGSVTYEEFLDSAADSPIVQQGSSDQMSVSVVVTRALEFNF